MIMNAEQVASQPVGHFNPAHEYPHFVVPVFRYESTLFAAYSRGEDLVRIDERVSGLVLHDFASAYDPSTHGLFALSPQHVVPYSLDDPRAFFADQLESESLLGANPFFKLSLAERATPDTLREYIRACILELGAADEGGYGHAWYQGYQ